MSETDNTTRRLLSHLHRGGSYGYYWTMSEATVTRTNAKGDDYEARDERTFWFPVDRPPRIPAQEVRGTLLHVYFGVHPTYHIPERISTYSGKVKPSQYVRAKIEDIAAINCLFGDFDDKQLADIAEFSPPPSVIVQSSTGKFQAYWLLDSPLLLATDEQRTYANRVQAAWRIFVDSDRGAKDIARVLRIPGTRNVKTVYGPDYPVAEFIKADFSLLYTFNELVAHCETFIATGVANNGTASTDGTATTRDIARQKLSYALHRVRSASNGHKHQTLLGMAKLVGGYLHHGAYSEHEAAQALYDAIEGKADNPKQAEKTIRDGIAYGKAEPLSIDIKELAPIARPASGTTAIERVDTTTGEIISEDEVIDPDRPTIEVLDMDIPHIAGKAWAAVKRLNSASTYPALFRRGTALCRVEQSEAGASLVVVERRRLRGVLARACVFQQTRTNKKGVSVAVVSPPEPIVDDMLVNSDPALPSINRVVYAPCLAPDGSLLTTAGYHAAARAFYDPRRGVTIPPLSDEPTRDEMERARAIILDELLIDFPFVEDADRAHAVALLLLPFVRELISGPTPLHLIEAPVMGSGKGLLTDVLITASTGVAPTAMAAPAEEAEWGKKITSVLLSGPSTIFIDNINHTLDSGALAAALTTTEWTDRILGFSEMGKMPVRCAWVATANNPMLSTEIARRCIRIRIDPKIDKPWERDGFKHPNLRQWMLDHQGDLIWASITLARYGMAHGASGRALGSYEGWSTLLGRILHGIEVPGFLDNLDALYERADVQSAAWRALVEAWWETHSSAQVQAADLFTLVERDDIDLSLRGKTDRALRVAFGIALSRMQDRVLTLAGSNPAAGSMRLRIETKGTANRLKLWQLVPVEQDMRPTSNVSPVSNVSPAYFLRANIHAHARAHDALTTPGHTLDTGDTLTATADDEKYQNPEGSPGSPDLWAKVPAERLATLKSNLRSINPKMQAQAREWCDRYRIDYETARAAVEEAI